MGSFLLTLFTFYCLRKFRECRVSSSTCEPLTGDIGGAPQEGLLFPFLVSFVVDQAQPQTQLWHVNDGGRQPINMDSIQQSGFGHQLDCCEMGAK